MLMFSSENGNSGKLPQKFGGAVLSLENDDFVLFKNIKVTRPDGQILDIEPIVFTITN